MSYHRTCAVKIAEVKNTIESDKRYGCFNGNQFKESVDVKSSHRTTLQRNGSSNGRCGMRPKTGRAEQIFKVYSTTGGNRGRDSLKKLAPHD